MMDANEVFNKGELISKLPDPPKDKRPTLPSLKSAAIGMYRSGASVSDIAEVLGQREAVIHIWIGEYLSLKKKSGEKSDVE